jgi:hypothetical protein
MPDPGFDFTRGGIGAEPLPVIDFSAGFKYLQVQQEMALQQSRALLSNQSRMAQVAVDRETLVERRAEETGRMTRFELQYGPGGHEDKEREQEVLDRAAKKNEQELIKEGYRVRRVEAGGRLTIAEGVQNLGVMRVEAARDRLVFQKSELQVAIGKLELAGEDLITERDALALARARLDRELANDPLRFAQANRELQVREDANEIAIARIEAGEKALEQQGINLDKRLTAAGAALKVAIRTNEIRTEEAVISAGRLAEDIKDREENPKSHASTEEWIRRAEAEPDLKKVGGHLFKAFHAYGEAKNRLGQVENKLGSLSTIQLNLLWDENEKKVKGKLSTPVFIKLENELGSREEDAAEKTYEGLPDLIEENSVPQIMSSVSRETVSALLDLEINGEEATYEEKRDALRGLLEVNFANALNVYQGFFPHPADGQVQVAPLPARTRRGKLANIAEMAVAGNLSSEHWQKVKGMEIVFDQLYGLLGETDGKKQIGPKSNKDSDVQRFTELLFDMAETEGERFKAFGDVFGKIGYSNKTLLVEKARALLAEGFKINKIGDMLPPNVDAYGAFQSTFRSLLAEENNTGMRMAGVTEAGPIVQGLSTIGATEINREGEESPDNPYRNASPYHRRMITSMFDASKGDSKAFVAAFVYEFEVMDDVEKIFEGTWPNQKPITGRATQRFVPHENSPVVDYVRSGLRGGVPAAQNYTASKRRVLELFKKWKSDNPKAEHLQWADAHWERIPDPTDEDNFVYELYRLEGTGPNALQPWGGVAIFDPVTEDGGSK